MRLLVFGPRDWTDYTLLSYRIGDFLWDIPDDVPVTLVEGEARGVDKMSRQYFSELIMDGAKGLSIDDYPANWTAECPGCYDTPVPHRKFRGEGNSWCPKQGPIRNQRMLDSGVDHAIGFSWNPMVGGTKDMYDRLVGDGFVEGDNLIIHYGKKGLN